MKKLIAQNKWNKQSLNHVIL